jgi:hypothetical protein
MPPLIAYTRLATVSAFFMIIPSRVCVPPGFGQHQSHTAPDERVTEGSGPLLDNFDHASGDPAQCAASSSPRSRGPRLACGNLVQKADPRP